MGSPYCSYEVGNTAGKMARRKQQQLAVQSWLCLSVGQQRIAWPHQLGRSRIILGIDSASFVFRCRQEACWAPYIMDSRLDIPLKPEDEELKLKKKELQILEARLIECELGLHSLKGELAAFENLYVRNVGIHYAELDEINAEIAELLARENPSNHRAQEAARQARARANESREGSQSVAQENARFSPSVSLKNLYREVARKIHPDLAGDDADRAKREQLMAEANQAYEKGDESRIRSILEEYENSPDSVSGQGPGPELVRLIRKIAQVKKRIKEIESETEQVRASDLFELKRRFDEAARQGRDVLNEMALALRSKIDDRRTELRRMHQREQQ
jgi:hypothetical protein